MTIVSTQKLRECQDFIDKVGEIRFNKVKLRQLNKLNLLTIRKEGNITRFNNTNTNNLASCNLKNSQANLNNSQVNPPLGKVSPLPRLTLPLPGKESLLLRPIPPPQATTHSYSLRSTQSGQASNTTRASRQGNRCPPTHRSTQASQEVNTTSWEGNTSISPPVGIPKVLPMKNLTLSGS